MLLAAGPSFRAGRVSGLAALDIFTLPAELKGLPLAGDLEGRPARAALGPLFVAGDEPWRPVTYGPRDHAGAGASAGADDAERLERLRALGPLR